MCLCTYFRTNVFLLYFSLLAGIGIFVGKTKASHAEMTIQSVNIYVR